MRRMPWGTLALVVMAVVAAVLSFAALRATQPLEPPQPQGSVLTTPSPTPSRDEAPDDDEADATEDAEAALPPVAEPPLLMVAADVAFRATFGSCLGGATLERTTDGGGRWKSASVPAAGVYGLQGSGALLEVVGVDRSCTLRRWTSSDGGRTWSASSRASGVFSRLPDTTRRIATPDRERPSPCRDRSVAPVAIEQISDSEAAVLCDGGQVFTTANGGQRWSRVAPIEGAEALAFDGPVLGWVLVGADDVCPGYRLFRTVNGGLDWAFGGCVGTEELPDDRSRPSVSFRDPEVGMADLAGDTYVTTDAGFTWVPAR